MRRRAAILFFVLGLGSSHVESQIIPTNRTVNWSTAGCSIPSASWNLYALIQPSGDPSGVADWYSIQTGIVGAESIASASNPQIVYLAAGNFVTFSNWIISSSFVEIRGAGPALTFITPTSAALNPVFWFDGNNGRYSGDQQFAALWGGYSQGSKTLILSNAVPNAGSLLFTNGQDIMIDQLNDGTFVNAAGNEGNCAYCSVSNGIRSLTQCFKITSIVNGTNVNIDTPLYWNYNTNYTAGTLPPFGSYTNNLQPEISWYPVYNISNVGIQNLSINDINVTNSVGAYNSTLMFQDCDYSWQSNVFTQWGSLNHTEIYACYHGTFVDNCLSQSKNRSSSSYGFELSQNTCGCLIQDNIANYVVAAVVAGWGSVGNVIAYNFVTNSFRSDSPAFEANTISLHDCHVMYNLIEGNDVPQIFNDNIHGSGSHQTFFRNRSRGWQPNVSENCVAINDAAHSTYEAFVGNVLGTLNLIGVANSGLSFPEEYAFGTNSFDISQPGIYAFGYYVGYNDAGTPLSYWDSNTVYTAIVDANFDYLTGGVTYNTNNINLSATNLLNSFYLSGQPGWWTNWGPTPYPPIGPDVSGYANPLPAQLRFLALTDPTILSIVGSPAGTAIIGSPTGVTIQP